jgi:hypothetical protein
MVLSVSSACPAAVRAGAAVALVLLIGMSPGGDSVLLADQSRAKEVSSGMYLMSANASVELLSGSVLAALATLEPTQTAADRALATKVSRRALRPLRYLFFTLRRDGRGALVDLLPGISGPMNPASRHRGKSTPHDRYGGRWSSRSGRFAFRFEPAKDTSWRFSFERLADDGRITRTRPAVLFGASTRDGIHVPLEAVVDLREITTQEGYARASKLPKALELRLTLVFVPWSAKAAQEHWPGWGVRPSDSAPADEDPLPGGR